MTEQTRAETVPAEAVRRSLDGCLSAPVFRRSPKLAAFLTYIVEEELGGRGDAIKAYTIATQALGRSDSFDPSNDPSVRVEAGRLRRVLDEVYADEGRRLPVRIQVPVGAYRPSFEVLPNEEPPPPAPAPAPAPILQAAGFQTLPLFDTRGQAVLAVLLAIIAVLLTAEVVLQIYALVQGAAGG
ncbi:hypothetical protein [Methylobacterium nonmethylotrophicum]|uniref:Uncharacterized protein n=1 Tax=Methylobacterium nonmethylotrophicum TaxID=1141884 RepID=A0A4Z0NJ13_9HYPH|nr:hypothetical protein [Methylobacterium nonmethylotrophicum]TGD96285.1 hypothetical protein EU555_24135 [Methylobacterium nonmethylotrophicum]